MIRENLKIHKNANKYRNTHLSKVLKLLAIFLAKLLAILTQFVFGTPLSQGACQPIVSWHCRNLSMTSLVGRCGKREQLY